MSDTSEVEGKEVCLVHDDPSVLKSMHYLLASEGFSALGAPEWFTTKLENFDLLCALIDVVILGIDTTGKLVAVVIRGIKT